MENQLYALAKPAGRQQLKLARAVLDIKREGAISAPTSRCWLRRHRQGAKRAKGYSWKTWTMRPHRISRGFTPGSQVIISWQTCSPELPRSLRSCSRRRKIPCTPLRLGHRHRPTSEDIAADGSIFADRRSSTASSHFGDDANHPPTRSTVHLHWMSWSRMALRQDQQLVCVGMSRICCINLKPLGLSFLTWVQGDRTVRHQFVGRLLTTTKPLTLFTSASANLEMKF